jgi:hypothetical protein
MKQNDTYQNLQKHLFFKNTKIDYNIIIMFAPNNLIIVIGNAKQHKAQILKENSCETCGLFIPYFHN